MYKYLELWILDAILSLNWILKRFISSSIIIDNGGLISGDVHGWSHELIHSWERRQTDMNVHPNDPSSTLGVKNHFFLEKLSAPYRRPRKLRGNNFEIYVYFFLLIRKRYGIFEFSLKERAQKYRKWWYDILNLLFEGNFFLTFTVYLTSSGMHPNSRSSMGAAPTEIAYWQMTNLGG